MAGVWYNQSMQPNIITSGRKYLDIDAYAGIIAYRELQHALGNNQALAISTAPLNQSIPQIIPDLSYSLDDQEICHQNVKLL